MSRDNTALGAIPQSKRMQFWGDVDSLVEQMRIQHEALERVIDKPEEARKVLARIKEIERQLDYLWN